MKVCDNCKYGIDSNGIVIWCENNVYKADAKVNSVLDSCGKWVKKWVKA